MSKKKKSRKEERKARKLRLCKLYEAAMGFYQSGGGGRWSHVVDGYQRGLNDVKYSL